MSRNGAGNRYRYRSGSRPGSWGDGSGKKDKRQGLWRGIAIALVVVMLAAIIVSIVLGVRGCTDAGTTPTPGVSPTPTPLAVGTPLPTLEPLIPEGLTEADAIALDAEAADVPFTHHFINHPVIYGSKMAYSSGDTTSIRTNANVLKDLYIYDFLTEEETLIASSQLKGEISEIQLNDDYLVWVDSDNYTKHSIWRHMLFVPTEIIGEDDTEEYYEEEEELTPDPSASPAPASNDNEEVGISYTVTAEIRQIQHRKPRLRLYADNLVYTMEDAELGNDQLYLINPRTGEDTSLAVIQNPSAYGASPPDISGNQVIWAMHDPGQPDEDVPVSGERSAIYYVYIDREHLEAYPTDPETSYIIPDFWPAGMYVDKPQVNDDVWIWTDQLGIGGKLWLRDLQTPYAEPVVIAENDPATGALVNSISLIEGYVVYCKNQTIYAYNYVDKQYYRLTPLGEVHMTPSAGGKRVVWFPKTGDGEGDRLMTVMLP